MFKNAGLGVVFGQGFLVTLAAERLVSVLFTQDDQFLGIRQAVGMVGQSAAADADGVNFLDVFGDGHQTGHGAERLAEIVGIQTGDDHTDATLVGQLLDYIYNTVIEELGFVDAHDADVGIDLKHAGRRFDGRAGNAVGIRGDHVQL